MSFDPWQVAACFLGGIIFGFVWPGVWKSPDGGVVTAAT